MIREDWATENPPGRTHDGVKLCREVLNFLYLRLDLQAGLYELQPVGRSI